MCEFSGREGGGGAGGAGWGGGYERQQQGWQRQTRALHVRCEV